jgi:DNA polymerase-3 subunit delta
VTPDRLLADLQKRPPERVYLFLGPESYSRDRCRRAIVEAFLDPQDREAGLVRHDLSETPLQEVLDDARCYSLFSPKRVLWAAGAEAVLPRLRSAEASEGGGAASGGAEILASYLNHPSPDVVLIFDCSRYEMDGEDKARLDRVRKFYAGIPNVVEFARFTPDQAARLASELARALDMRIDPAGIRLLVESTAANAQAIALELEKLRLYAPGRPVTVEDIATLVPSARATTLFALVNALARKQRRAALDHLDTLVREGEYLPLALAFLATQLRQALVAAEAGLREPRQILSHFSRLGVPMWPSRAEQIADTLNVFSPSQMANALPKLAALDSALRDIRPDDRIVLEEFVLTLNA